ncbi:PAS domain S-box protein [Pseudodesulfovibrio cashew]|uniref:PAS domain S-box protein n=1 Tax=Pseudodesulfovibrio cashew TaxID=2678688 RepID=A0A6I6JJC0_9BACT|nr:LuxR family transcriptional regulator [Pseudodesulfovibrio cashew]QGY40463.1 PAS domain S-box protein [Pseudodesulfovibrio cashew]
MKSRSEQQKYYWDMIESLVDEEAFFLERWSVRMEQAGYLEHTTAKRDDCLLALSDFLAPMRQHWDKGFTAPDFSWLIRHEDDWGQRQIESARRHRMRGITADMYLGCFKTFIQSLIDVIEKMEGSYESKVQARRFIKLYGDALEVLFVRDWTRTLPDIASRKLDEANRLLTLQKCRYENILDSTSDLILVVDNGGIVTNVNKAVEAVTSDQTVLGRPVWEALSMEGQSMEDMLKYYPIGISCETSPFDNDSVYRLQITPIGNVSMASDEYMIMLTNVTAHATQREALERVVSDRTEALRKEKEHLEEMNITLRNVLQSIDKERDELLKEVSTKVNNQVIPALDRIENEEDAAIRKGYITVVRDQLTRLAPGSKATDPLLLKLTHMETRVCQFIQAGYPSKDIAGSLNISLETVQTHRKNIRRKLGLHGKSVSLYAHLKTQGVPL